MREHPLYALIALRWELWGSLRSVVCGDRALHFSKSAYVAFFATGRNYLGADVVTWAVTRTSNAYSFQSLIPQRVTCKDFLALKVSQTELPTAILRRVFTISVQLCLLIIMFYSRQLKLSMLRWRALSCGWWLECETLQPRLSLLNAATTSSGQAEE